ncbi:endoribonuclease XendoU [Ancylostoma caninum]|uniref:Endoribonuclease XendoU n=1 Tax=Ancylostoma caninum TaxID=29170 RepID=A0A368FCA3_ANCCA|nr:endoribonuclease XendoU [Ancylostoma caninum]
MELSMLLNTSPEFEMAAYTICALTGGECEFTVNGDDVNLVAKTITVNDEVMIDDCHPYVSGGITQRPKPGTGSTKKPKPSDEKFQTLVDKMRAADVDRAGAGDYKLDFGNRASGTSDNSDNDLFVYVNETLFQRPVYANLLALLKRKVFINDVCEKEAPMSGLRKTQIQLLLDTWTNTKVFRLAFDYMHAKGEKHATTFEAFKKFLFNFWFGTYSRCNGPVGSSGFEHVFTGEWKRGTVGGHHSWVTYYAAQKAGKINYHGYFSTVSDLAGTFQYRWQSVFKKKGGFLFGTSPAFDFSLFTVCSLMYPGTAGCRYSIDGYSLGVTSFTQSCSSGLCLATAYPIN